MTQDGLSSTNFADVLDRPLNSKAKENQHVGCDRYFYFEKSLSFRQFIHVFFRFQQDNQEQELVLDTWVLQVGNNNSNGLFTRELTLNTTFLRRKLQELR